MKNQILERFQLRIKNCIENISLEHFVKNYENFAFFHQKHINTLSLNFKPSSCASSSISARVLNDKNLSMTNEKLIECIALFGLVYVYDAVNDKFHSLSKIVVGIVDEFAPIKKFRLKKDSNGPWMDKELLFLIV